MLRACRGMLAPRPVQMAFSAYNEPLKKKRQLKSSTFKIGLVAGDCVLLGAWLQGAARGCWLPAADRMWWGAQAQGSMCTAHRACDKE